LVDQLWLADVTPTEKLFLLAIADCSTDEGFAHPSINYLAWRTGLARTTVIDLLSKYKDIGVLNHTGNSTERGSKIYHLDFNKLTYKKPRSQSVIPSTPVVLDSTPAVLSSIPIGLGQKGSTHSEQPPVARITPQIMQGTAASLAQSDSADSIQSRTDRQSALELEYPTSLSGVEKVTRTPDAKSQHSIVRSYIQERYRAVVGQNCPWDGRTGTVLNRTLDRLRWSNDAIQQAIDNRFHSDGVVLSEDPTHWIPRLDLYLNGPVNKFKQPTNARPAGVNYGTATTINRAEQRQQGNLAALAEAKRRSGYGATDDRRRGDGGTTDS
jgi:hypothetical protein